MKFGPFEGSPQEIRNFFQDNGLRAADYLALPDPPITTIWFAIPGAVLVGTLAVLTFSTRLATGAATFVFLVGCAAGLWLAVCAQLRFKNSLATGVIALGSLLLMLVALGAVTPLEMLQELKSLER